MNEKLTSFRLFTILICIITIESTKAQFVNESVLKTGNFYKIGIVNDGVYSLNIQDLQNLGVNVSGINVNTIRLFGNGARMLPESTAGQFIDDLAENAIDVRDYNQNGIFDAGDEIIFYGKGPNYWVRTGTCSNFRYEKNLYTDTSFYFLQINSNNNGLRIQSRNSVSGSADITINKFDDFLILEKDSLNLVESGKRWFWKEFNIFNNYNFSVNLSGIDLTSPVNIQTTVAERCLISQGSFNLKINNQTIETINPGTVSSNYDGPIGRLAEGCSNHLLSSGAFTISIQKTDNVCEKGWLDYIQFNYKRNLIKNATQLHFRSIESENSGIIQCTISNFGNSLIWDVSNPLQPIQQLHTGGTFRYNGGSLVTFIAFDNSNFLKPALIGKVNNQNLHGLGYADLIIVTPPDFINQSYELAQHHYDHDGFTSHVVTTTQIYNEFSSGAQDISAIRNFARMFYKKHQNGLIEKMPPYLLLFGDASYDYKTHLNRTYRDSGGVRININTNLVPTFQTQSSLERAGWSFATDDFYALLGDNVDINLLTKQTLHIGVGRLLASNQKQASELVNKIKHYLFNKDCQRDWRNIVTFVADDMEASWEGQFVTGSELLANFLKNNYPVWNIEKIYLDAYTQIVSSGQRYPEAQKALFDRINNGSLLVNYIGHGGELGLSSERVLSATDVSEWKNFDRMPAFLTATCTFTRYDNPNLLSAGEMIHLRPDGGGIALFSTIRPIGTVDNFNLPFYNTAFGFDSLGNRPRLGDILRTAKNKYPIFFPQMLLFGDPAMKLAYPENQVITEVIEVNGNDSDTLRSTDFVTVKGHIADPDGFKLNNFNGILYPTVFDKPNMMRTLQNDAQAARYDFSVQKSIIFKGKAKVENGDFEFSFKVPKDINYQFGQSKISYYAQNDVIDAHGYKYVITGGSSDYCQNDKSGPSIKLYLNDSYFINGGVTDANPSIYAELYDEGGINTTGAGIGHDIIATLSGPVSGEYILNEFYESDLNSYQSGNISYLLRNLPDGDYTLTLKVWDVCNNSSTATITFTVNTNGLIIGSFYNYPNPFNQSTTFSFQHNLPDENLFAYIKIFDLNGKLVHEIKQNVVSSGYRNVDITWDGTANGGGRLGSGIYFCNLVLINKTGKAASARCKIVMVN
jgi:hypothetical protein